MIGEVAAEDLAEMVETTLLPEPEPVERTSEEPEPETSEEPEKSCDDATDPEQGLMSDDESAADVGGASSSRVSPADISPDESPVSTMALDVSERSSGVAEAWVKKPTERNEAARARGDAAQERRWLLVEG